MRKNIFITGDENKSFTVALAYMPTRTARLSYKGVEYLFIEELIQIDKNDRLEITYYIVDN